LGIEILEDRTVPDAVPSFPFSTPTLIAASLNAGANVSMNGNSLMTALANSVVFDLGALTSSLAQEATFLNSIAASSLPGGLSVPPILGSNPTLMLNSSFALFQSWLNSFGGPASDVASTLNDTFGAGMGFSSGNT
jgi:hypothetical protein